MKINHIDGQQCRQAWKIFTSVTASDIERESASPARTYTHLNSKISWLFHMNKAFITENIVKNPVPF